MARLYNLARMSTATTGTGTLTLGSAVSGFLSFAASGVADGETITYAIRDGTNSEIGRGVYTASGTTLTRSVLRSTSSNTAIYLSGTAEVIITAAAEDFEPRINAQTGTTYTVLSSDLGKTITLSNASAISVTLPQATGAFAAGYHATFVNVGSSTVTITPTTSLISGAATFTLNRSQACTIVSDGTNWIVLPMTGLRGATASVASASTCDIGSVATDRVSVTGTTTITSFGAVPNVMRFGAFEGALTLTHNATTLNLPGGASITTAAKDRFIAVSDSSGNWTVLGYWKADGSPVAINSGSITYAMLASAAIATAAQYQANTASLLLTTDKVWTAAGTVALTDGATITPDFSAGLNFTVTLGGSRTLASPSNVKVGQAGFIRIAQDGTGSRTLAYGSNWKFANGAAPTLSTAASKVDVLFYQVTGASEIVANMVKAVV